MHQNNRLAIPSLTTRWKHGSSTPLQLLWYGSFVALIIFGWLKRDQGWLTAENGLGYALGITGALLMLLLLTYSLRKRWKAMRRILTVKFWFRLHMTLGILGPVAVLFHCNFRLASLNSSVSLICMLLVAGSGLVGRYLYSKIHYGLYGNEIKVKNILKDFQGAEQEVLELALLEQHKQIAKKLFSAIEQLILQQGDKKIFFVTKKDNLQAKKIIRSMNLLMTDIGKHHKKHTTSPAKLEKILAQINERSVSIMNALDRIPSLRLYERLFSLWHVIHIPIYVMMMISIIVHVWVVHMY